MENLTFDNRARYTIKECPCRRSNKDGKFCPFKGYTDKGYCHSCGETFLPNTQRTDKDEVWRQSDEWKRPITPSVIEPNFIEETTVQQTLKQYDENNFTRFLKTTFHNDTAVLNDVIKRFSIGTAKGNKTIFWQRDTKGNFRTGQIMLYNPITGNRNKDIKPNWVHTFLKLQNFHLVQCFYGESQLLNDSKTVAIVEAPKTAAIMTPIEPRYTWIATGGATQLKAAKCEILKGKKIVLYPDLGKFDEWTIKAKELKNSLGLDICVSNFLETYVSKMVEDEKNEHIKNGYDIADYAIKSDWYGETRKENAKTLPLSKDEQILQSMIHRQPLVKNLILSLGLVNSKTMKPYQNI